MIALRIAMTVALLAMLVAPVGADVRDRARRQFDDGDYAGGRKTLLDALDAPDLPVVERARLTAALARFYEDLVGSEIQPRRHWQAIVDMPLAADHALAVDARENLTRPCSPSSTAGSCAR